MGNKKSLRQITNFCANNKLTTLIFDFLKINTVFLNYHRVISDQEYLNEKRPNNDLIVTESNFEKQIKYLKQNFNIISINDIDKNLKQKKNVVITFDDGYFDNFRNALPILKKYECPATIYIVTSFLNNKNYPWWLKIWKIIEKNEHLTYNQKKINISDNKSKLKVYHFFCKKIFSMKQLEQNSFFSEICKDLNQIPIIKKDEFLSDNDLKRLDESKLIEIGCHTHTHQNLKLLDDNELKYEINSSKNILEQMLRKKINHFSIPFGTKDSFTEKTIKSLQKFNFKTIVSTEHGNFNKENLFTIPRIGIGNDDLEESLYSKALGFDSFINKILNR